MSPLPHLAAVAARENPLELHPHDLGPAWWTRLAANAGIRTIARKGRAAARSLLEAASSVVRKSTAQLAHEAGCSRKTVQRSRSRLRRLGVLHTSQRHYVSRHDGHWRSRRMVYQLAPHARLLRDAAHDRPAVLRRCAARWHARGCPPYIRDSASPWRGKAGRAAFMAAVGAATGLWSAVWAIGPPLG